MAKHNAGNERIKRDYFRMLKNARGYDDASIDAVAASISRFEVYTRHKAFERFHFEQAIGFKQWLAEQLNQRTGRPLSKATLRSTLRAVREFFLWLGGQPGFRSRINYADSAYFRLTEKDDRVALVSVETPAPTLEQIEYVLARMPASTTLQRRDRAVIAFTILTGARDNAVASLRVKHVDLPNRFVFQDPRLVRTKASKAIRTWFFPIGGLAEQFVADWVAELREQHKWGTDDPLFPATDVGLDARRQFAPVGLLRSNWKNADPIRKIFRTAFETAGLPYFIPHSFRKTLAQLGEQVCRTPEEFKAWSQNLGHEQVLTTFSSYGAVSGHRQAEIILGLQRRGDDEEDLESLLARAMQKAKRAA